MKTQPATRKLTALLTVSSSLRPKSNDPILSTRASVPTDEERHPR